MDLYELDIIRAISLLYIVSFVWHYITHHIRFVMVKYYVENGHIFENWHMHGMNLDHISKGFGTGILGISYHRSPKRSYSWIMDIIYYFLVFAFPIYLLILSQKYLRSSDQAVSGIKKILQDGEAGKSFSLGMFWLLFCGLLPHLWAFYFNRKRFKYYIAQQNEYTRWGQSKS